MPRLNTEINIGNKSTSGFNGGFSTVEGNTYLAFNVGAKKNNAGSATNARAPLFIYNTDKDAYSNTNVVVKVAHTLWQGETVAAQVWQSRGKAQFDAGPIAAENQQTLGGAQFESSNQIMPWWHSKLVAASTHDSINISGEYPATFATKQNQLQWQNTVRTAVGTILLGAEQNRQSLTSSTNYDKSDRTTLSVFASLSEQQESQYLQANVRLDKFSLTSDSKAKQTTGQVAYGVRVWPEELVYGTVARGYKLPSFNDLYYPGFSNPALKPEQNINTEIGYKFERKGTRYADAMTASAALYDNKIEDLISFNGTTAKPENISRAHIRGLELAANGQWQGFDVRAAITAQRPLDADTKLQLRGRAKVFGSAGLAKTIGKFSGGIDVVAVGKRYDSANEAPESRLGGYATLSARLQYNISKQFSAEVVGSNLTNQPYEQTTGYNTPRRQVMFNLKFSAQ
jgi:vitamin B12 transporter